MKVSNIVHYTREELTKAKRTISSDWRISKASMRMPNQLKAGFHENTGAPRQASLHRATKETDIRVEWTRTVQARGRSTRPFGF